MTLISINPAIGESLGEIDGSTRDEVAQAVSRTRAAWLDWKTLPVSERLKALSRFRDLLEENGPKIANLSTGEMGGPLSLSCSVSILIQSVALANLRCENGRLRENLRIRRNLTGYQT